MNAKFYRFIVKGNDKKGGVLYSPKSWPYPIAVDGQEVKNWESLVVELKDGIYRPFQLCVGGANMVNQDLKDLLQSFIGISNDVEFLPVRAISEIYGEQTYYIMHFKKIFDVIDTKNTLYVETPKDVRNFTIEITDITGKLILKSENQKEINISGMFQ